MLQDNPKLEALVAAARNGDSGAKELLLTEVSASFRLIVKHRIMDQPSETREDIVQSACSTVVEKLADADLSKGFAPWAYSILRNHIGNAYQRRDRESKRRAPSELIASIAEQGEANILFRLAFEDCLRQLQHDNPRYSEIVELCSQGYKTDEICDALRITPTNCHSILSRARAKLKQCLAAKGIRC
jgi:RNA polymerase sigma factor (sigma-70 family)